MRRVQTCVCAAVILVAGSGCWTTPEGWACDSKVPCPTGFLCLSSVGAAVTGDSAGSCVSESGQDECRATSNTTCPSGQICNLSGQCATPEYTESNGVVTDSVTGLLWQQAVPSNPCPSDGSGVCTWSDAVSYCSGLSLGGFSTGWRLPALNELFSLVETGQTPTIDSSVFPIGSNDQYVWTDTCDGPCSGDAWSVNFILGYVFSNLVDLSLNVRCVR